MQSAKKNIVDKERILKLEIDISNCRSEIEIIEKFITTLEFPDLYRKSWFGLKEHFYYDPMLKVPKTLILKGMKELKVNTPNLYRELTRILEYFYKEVKNESHKNIVICSNRINT